MASVVIFGWNYMPGHRKKCLCQQRPYIRYFAIFRRTPNTHLQQILKVIIVLGVTMLVLGSCCWLLWSCVVELLCLDTNKKGSWCRPFIRCFSIFRGTPNTHLQQNLKAIIVLGIIMVVLDSCGCLMWSHVVEIICLDTNKTRWTFH